MAFHKCGVNKKRENQLNTEHEVTSGLLDESDQSVIANMSYKHFIANLKSDPISSTSASAEAAADAVRAHISIQRRRSNGIFFTPSTIASIMIDASGVNGGVVIDPSCGGGDLLLAASRRMKLEATLAKTLKSWSERLWGYDINSDFVESARLRLIRDAAHRHGVGQQEFLKASRSQFLAMIRVGDTSVQYGAPGSPCTVIMNPPYVTAPAGRDLHWANGSINHAALHLEATLKSVATGSKVVALLPEVIRSGTRYAKFQDRVISAYGSIESERSLGQFDSFADVDVYLLVAAVGRSLSKKEMTKNSKSKSSIQLTADVSVGAVIPHRHPLKGDWVPYLTVHDVTVGDVNCHALTRRRFSGTVVRPPFVVIRRTSRPGSNRAAAAVVRGSEPIAVENHLIVVRPRSSKIDECVKLMRYLNSEAVDEILNVEMRCRHLTVRSIGNLAWQKL